jgi:hypothetical protein
MTLVEEQLNRIEAMVRVLMDSQRPQISFAEIQHRLGYKSKNSTQKWIKRHALVRVGPRQFRFIDFINAATKPVPKEAA